MRFEGLSLEHFRCYETADVPFEPGVTVVHGPNGSGKSSLLDACFFALYGSNTLEGTTLDEVITTGADEARVSLTFSDDGTTYELSRELRARGGRAQTVTCELRNGTDPITGARAVRSAVARMLRMDAAAFLNCAYVRQGEVNKLIQATPSERQDMIDELLQLGVLEKYRDRATGARRGIASLRDGIRGQVEGLADQIERKEEKELAHTLNELESTRQACEERLERLDEQAAEAEETRAAARDIIERFEQRRAELERVKDEIASIRSAIEESETERSTCTDRFADLADERARIEDRLDSMHESLGIDERTREAATEKLEGRRTRDDELREAIEDARIALQRERQTAEQADERATELAERATALEEEATERAEQLESDEAAIAERRQDLERLRDARSTGLGEIEAAGFSPEEVDAHVERAEAEIAALRDRESDLAAKIEALEDDIAETEALIEAGKCPTCGQAVHGAPPVSEIEEDRERLAALEEELDAVRVERERAGERLDELHALVETKREIERVDERIASIAELIDEREASVAERYREVEELRESAADARTAVDAAEETAADAREQITDVRERIAALNERRAGLKDVVSEIETLLETYERRQDVDAELAQLRERRDGIDELNDERRDRLAEKREHRRELAEAVDEQRVDEARETLERADAYLERAAERREGLATERDDLLDRIGRVQAEFDELRELRERRDTLDQRHTAIKTVHEDVHRLESMYRTLRSELREQNVTALERMLNETFELVYRNDAYDRIELDREYRFTVFQKDGEALSPEQLSGGERALFNLSLRCAIYRLLTEGIEGAATLPPLILDEPTVYLDDGHVTRLVELVEAMRDLGVEQIILVTHDRELLRAADVTLTVEKDATTNRSTVSAEPARAAALPRD